MKYNASSLLSKSFLTVVCMLALQAFAFAQDDGSSSVVKTTTTTSSTNWYTQPWVWVVGGAVFIILLVALLRGNSTTADRTERVTVTKSTSTDV